MRREAEVIIAGAGLVGATLALALAREGVAVILIDAAQPEDAPDPRASSVAYAAFRIWRALGLEPELAPHAQPVGGIVVDAGEGAAPLAFDPFPSDGHRDAHEPLGWMVENARVRAVLTEALAATGATVLAGACVTAVDAQAHGATVGLADGSRLSTALVVGAEGRRSAVREAAPIAVATRDYSQTGLTATLRLEMPHGGVARQRFLPGGPLALLPLADLGPGDAGDRASLVWSLPNAQAQALAALSEPLFEAHLARRVGDLIGAARLAGPRTAFPLSAQTAERLVARRTALVGDAAHAIHPIAGQGLNLGLKDVAALAQVLVEARRLGEDLGADAVLDRYARWRRLDRTVLTLGVDGVARLFSNPAAPERLVSRAALAAARVSPGLRQALMREAGADAGDLPRLLRGLAL